MTSDWVKETRRDIAALPETHAGATDAETLNRLGADDYPNDRVLATLGVGVLIAALLVWVPVIWWCWRLYLRIS